MSAKLCKAKTFKSLAEASIPIQHVVRQSLIKAKYYANKLISSSHTCIKISMTLETWNTRMHRSFNFIRKLPNYMLQRWDRVTKCDL
jgi:hypothetical protein